MAGFTPQTSIFPENECRILLIGKTGAGKSSTGNNILGLKPPLPEDSDKTKKGFAVVRGALKSITKTCEIKYGMRGNLKISVTDSPGLEDTARKPEEIYQDIATSLTFVNPGPHVLLLVYKFDRFTDQDFKNYLDFKKLLGDDIINYIIVIFTNVENLVDDEDEDLCEAFKKEIKENSPQNLKSVLNETGRRYFPFSNKVKGSIMKQQVDKLFKMIDQLMLANKGSYFQCIYTESINKQLKEMIAEKMRSQEDREAKQRELEAKDRADREDIEKQLAQLNQSMLLLQLQQSNQENEMMKSLLEDIRQGIRNPPHITVAVEKGPCNVM